MQKLWLLWVCVWAVNSVSGQWRIASTTKNRYAQSLIAIYADAASGFKQSKGSSITSKHGTQKQYKAKLLPLHALDGKLMYHPADSTLWGYYTLAKIKTIDEAEAALLYHSEEISNAMGRKITLRTSTSFTDSTTIKQEIVSYLLPMGFFHATAYLQVCSVQQGYVVRMVVPGKQPAFFYTIQRNDPRCSNLFTANFKKAVAYFENNTGIDAATQLPGFYYVNSGNMIFEKWSDNLPHGKFEFDNAITNIRSSVARSYVYTHVPITTKDSVAYRTIFTQFNEYDLPQRKTIELSLVKQTDGSAKVRIQFCQPKPTH